MFGYRRYHHVAAADYVAVEYEEIRRHRLLQIRYSNRDVASVAIQQFRCGWVLRRGECDETLGIHLIRIIDPKCARLAAQPSQSGDRIPATPAPTATKFAIHLDERVAQLAAGAGMPPVQMTVEVERPAENFSSVNDRKIPHPAAFPEPSLSYQKRPRMMVEHDWDVKTTGQFVSKRNSVECWGQIDGHDGAAISVDHASHGDADSQGRATRGVESPRDTRSNRVNDFRPSSKFCRQRTRMFRLDLTFQRNERCSDGSRHQQDTANWLRGGGKP
jgi:hypothetical protein